MFVKLIFDNKLKQEFSHENRNGTFSIEIDANDKIDNLKVLITIKFSNLDPGRFNIYNNGKMLSENSSIIQSGITPESLLLIKSNSSSCCLLI